MSVSESNNNIRIRTTPLGSDKYVKINLSQNFDFLEILSLKISQEEVYKKYCSDYGVIAGRVVCNDGVGVPNAKIAVFIPISDTDKERPEIRARYPYEFTSDVDINNIRYNLLLEKPRMDDLCHRSVGTFPEKRRIIDCDPWCEIHGKYYKYSTSTNEAGDYMIFGVPTGVQKVHMDVDLSDIGYLSQKPYEMISQGSPPTMFDSFNQFKTSNNLTQLPQIKTQEKTINVLPFWGNLDQCEIGINRVDFNLEYKIIPIAFFIGSIFSDTLKNSVNKRCRPRPDLGLNQQFATRQGVISSIRRTPYGGTEVYEIDGGRTIDDDGVWILKVPMNLETKITDEFGNLVDSGNPEIGIATKGRYRFKISFNENVKASRTRANAKFLVPNYGDYTFDDTTQDTINYNGTTYPNFAEMQWNGVYTVKQFISRFSNRSGLSGKNYIGIKDVANSGDINPFPYNNMSQDVSAIFILLCVIINLISTIIVFLNLFISFWNDFIDILLQICIPIVDFCPFQVFGFERLKLGCLSISLDDGDNYCPGCENNKPSADPCVSDTDTFFGKITNLLAVSFDVFKFNFAEDWINGTLYAFQFKLKEKFDGKNKFCNVINDIYGDNYVTNYNCGPSNYDKCTIFVQQSGIILYNSNENEYFYAAKNKNNNWLFPTDIYNLGSMKICDPLGNPKISTEIPATTFNIPDEDFGFTDCDQNGNNCVYTIGIEPFLITINCFATKSDVLQCINQRRICELGVDYNEDINAHEQLIDEDISTETVLFGPALLRSQLECLNVPIICDDCEDPPLGLFGDDWKYYRTGNLFSTAIVYGYDEISICNFYQRNQIKNSFYFYFGIIPGKTAMDKLISQYFAPCERTEPCPIFISGNVENNKCIGGTSGSITAYPKYGTPPYRYDWYYGYYIFNSSNNVPFSINGTNTIINLSSGTYTVVVSDSKNNICKKSFDVIDPSPFKVYYDYSPFICPNSNNGFIEITPAGGTPPYFIDWGNGHSVTEFSTANTNGSFYLTNLGPTAICTAPNNGGGSNNSVTYDFVYAISNLSLYADAYSGPQTATTTFGNAIQSNSSVSTQYFTAPSNGNYTFSYNFDVNVSSGPCGASAFGIGFIKNLTTFYGLIPSSTASTSSYHFTGTKTISMNAGDTITLRMRVSANNSGCILDQEGYTRATLRNAILSLIHNASGGSSGGGGTTNMPYIAQVWDSSGQYGCLNYSGISIDIVQSCGFTVTASTTNDYCSGSTKGTITWGPIGGGVPPFIYILENDNLNYYWSGTSIDNYKTKKYLTGGTCPGEVYTATCIDSCGVTASTTGIVVKSYLRQLVSAGYANFRSKCSNSNCGCRKDKFRNFYFSIFAGSAPSDQVTFTNTCLINNYSGSGGYFQERRSGNDSFNIPYCYNYIQDGDFWYTLPPPPVGTTIGTKTSRLTFRYNGSAPLLCDNIEVEVNRVEIGNNQSRVSWIAVSSNNWDSQPTGSAIICSSETVYVHELFMLNTYDCNDCKWTIKTNGCSDKITDAISCA